jgi:hypothetical protein
MEIALPIILSIPCLALIWLTRTFIIYLLYNIPYFIWRLRGGDDSPLQQLTDAQLHLFPGLPRVRAKFFKKKGRLVGYCRSPHVIHISRHAYETGSYEETVDTIRHEMIHAWQKWRLRPARHNKAFNKKAREIGVEEYWDKKRFRFFRRAGGNKVEEYLKRRQELDAFKSEAIAELLRQRADCHPENLHHSNGRIKS